MWIIIVILVFIILILIRFMLARDAQSSQIIKQGGMKNKYHDLINALMADPRTKIFSESPDSITLGLSNMGGTTIFTLIQTFGSLTVQWKVDSPVFGKHKMDWSFQENHDQSAMIEKIESDLLNYQNKVFKS